MEGGLNTGIESPRLAGVPAWLVALASAVMLGLVGLLAYLAIDQFQEDDDCVEAELLSSSKCQQLHGDLGTTLLICAIAAVVLLIALLVALLLIGRRERKRQLDSPAATPQTDLGDAPVRVCPVCSAQAKTHSETCPHCGSSYIRARRVRATKRLTGMSGAAKAALVATVLLIPLAGAAGAVALMKTGDREDESQQLADAEVERQEAAAAAKAAEREREAENAERKLRQVVVKELEDSITKDAQTESERSFAIVEGPILDTQCDPEGGEIDIEAVAQDFDCLAISKYNGDGTISGYNYSANVNYDKFSYTWRLGN